MIHGLYAGLLIGLALISPASAQSIAGQASVIDGDTIEIHGKRVRLFGIDAPETAQTCQDDAGKPYRCGQAAANALAEFIGSKTVRCEPRDVRPDGRDLPRRRERRGRLACPRRAGARFRAVFERLLRDRTAGRRHPRSRNVAGTFRRAVALPHLYPRRRAASQLLDGITLASSRIVLPD